MADSVLQGTVFPRGLLPDPESPSAVRTTLGEVEAALEQAMRAGPLTLSRARQVTAAFAHRPSPYLRRGRRLTYQVVLETGGGPRLEAGAQSLPGTIFVRIDPGGRRAWLTGLVLDRGPVGALAFLEATPGRPLVRTIALR